MIKKLLIFIPILPLFFILSSACSLITTDRTFIQEMDQDDGPFVPGQDFPVVSGDTGNANRSDQEILERTPKDGKEAKRYRYERTLEDELSDLLDQLPEEEYRHYLVYQDHFSTTSEKIFFLRIKTVAERDEYLLARGIDIGDSIKARQEQLSIRGRDIFVGMSKAAVTQSWGRPFKVDVAGNPRQENERWTFLTDGRPKHVFFERGRVRGWILD